MKSSLFKSKFVRLAICCLVVCCCLADVASGATKKKTAKKKNSSSTSASKSEKSGKSSSGSVSINSGAIGGSGAIQSGSTIDINPNMFNTQSVGSSGGTLAISAGLTKTGTGNLTLSGNNASTYISAMTSTDSIGIGPVVNNASLVINRTGNLSIPGVISGTGTISHNVGTTSFGGANTYSGITTISAGTTLASGSSSVGTLTFNGALTLSTGSRLNYEFGGFAQPSDLAFVSTANVLTINGGGLSLLQTGTTNPFSLNGVYNLIGYNGTMLGTGSLTIPSTLVTTQYFATQNSKPTGYRQTLGNYVQINNLTTTPVTAPVAALIGPVRPGTLTVSAGSLASTLGLTTLPTVTSTPGLIKIGNSTFNLIPYESSAIGSGTLSINGGGLVLNGNVPASITLGSVTFAGGQISTVPEPSTLVLAGLALAGAGVLFLRRQRRARLATV